MYRHSPELAGDAIFSIQQIFDLAGKLQLPVVSAGDLHDSVHPEAALVQSFYREVAERQVRLWEILGNHDHTRDSVSWANLLPGFGSVSSLHNQIVDVGRLRIAGLNSCAPEQVRAFLAGLPGDVNLVVLHVHLAEALPLGTPDLSIEELPIGSRPRLYLLGDIHGRFDWCSSDGRLKVIYPGSTWPTRVDENSPRFCVQVTCSPDDELQVAWHQLVTRPVLRATVSDCLDRTTPRCCLVAETIVLRQDTPTNGGVPRRSPPDSEPRQITDVHRSAAPGHPQP